MRKTDVSPLRYPGGKGKLAPRLCGMFSRFPRNPVFIEPYAGGAGMGLYFLRESLVSGLVLNDADPHVFSFWKTVLSENGAFLRRLEDTPVTLDEWKKQREIIFGGGEHDILETGFAAFFLNRANYCGVLHSTPVGGLKQSGKNRIDARFKKENLVPRLEFVGKQADKISVFNQKASGFLSSYEMPENAIVYLDPPYTDKDMLYKAGKDDLAELSDILKKAAFPWFMTINSCVAVKDVFSWAEMAEFDMKYCFLAERSRKKGTELIVWKNMERPL